jgi:chromosome partitioning protein
VKLPLVGVSEIARLAGLKKSSAVVNWRIRYDDFPAPVAELDCGPIYWWPHVEAWLRETGRL